MTTVLESKNQALNTSSVFKTIQTHIVQASVIHSSVYVC